MEFETVVPSFVYRAYLLRVWRDGEQGAWRASLQHAGTGERLYFATLERLCLFLLSLDDELAGDGAAPGTLDDTG